MSIVTLVKTIQDIMRKDVGVDGDAQHISQMVWLLFLKIFDDKEQEWQLTVKGYKPPLQSRFRWSNWAKDPEGMTGEELIDFVNNDLFPALKKLATTAGVSLHGKVVGSVFEDAYNYMKSGTRETADLFMALIMHLLKHDTGRAAVVLPDGFLFGEGVKTTLKRELLEAFNLHTIVRLPKGVFSPYTSIATNILFFEKGGPTKQVWFFEHPYPEGYKSYSRSKPLTIAEFDLEKAWWGGAGRKSRKTTRHAWKEPAQKLVARNYNLDCKNPHEVKVDNGDPEKLMREYQEITRQLQAAQAALKKELMAALGGR